MKMMGVYRVHLNILELMDKLWVHRHMVTNCQDLTGIQLIPSIALSSAGNRQKYAPWDYFLNLAYSE